MRIAILFVGELHDGGFNAIALDGAVYAARSELAEISVVSGIAYDQIEIRRRLDAVMPDVDGLVFVGGQGNLSVPDGAAAFPDKRFAVVQGCVSGPNLTSYDVRQEESAYLAGCLAALMTQTGCVGHLSGHRVAPGLKGRAAYVAGVRDTNPAVRLLTGFCGTQDDNHVVHTWARAEIAAGVDVMFTMLNGARQGAITACAETGTRQIGNARDWTLTNPAVFVGSAIARIDLGIRRAVDDMVAGRMPGNIVSFGLADGDYASLSLAKDVPPEIARQIAQSAERLRRGEIIVPENYDGPEFVPT